MTYFFKPTKSFVLISIGFFIPYLAISQSLNFTYGLLNRDLKFSQTPQIQMEPGKPVPDSLTLSDSITVPKGTLVYIAVSTTNPQNQILYAIDIGPEKTLILNRSVPIPYQSISSKKSNRIQKNLAKNSNIIGIYYPNQPLVDFICLINKKGEYLQNSSMAYVHFFQQNIYFAKRKVYLKQSNTSNLITTRIPENPSKSHYQFPIHTISTNAPDPTPYIISLKKISTKNCYTPNYDDLLVNLKNYETLTNSESHLQFHIIGTIDLNNDNTNELIIEGRGYENHYYLIYTYDKKWNLIYSGGGYNN